MEDQVIVELYWARDELAVSETDRKYGRYLLKLASNILQDAQDREECLSDTYMAAWDSIPPQRPHSLCAYLTSLLRRISIDRLRRNTAQKRGGTEYALSLSELADCVPGSAAPEDTLETKRLAEILNDFVRSLPKNERTLFVGRYFFMDKLKDVASYCGMRESKAKSMLFRIRCRLREHLEKEGFAL